MDLNKYQEWTDTTAWYPEAGTGKVAALSYATMGLVGEAGEIANKVKKLLRDGDTPEKRQAITDELGDVCWYLARLATELDIPYEDVFLNNQNKINDRRQRDKIHGSGDNR